MTTVFSTHLEIDNDAGIKHMAEAFSAECIRQGVWARAVTIPADNGVTLTLTIDDSLRCKPGPRMKATALSDERMQALRDSGMKPENIAKLAGISRATFYRRMAALDEEVTHLDY